MLIKVLGSGAGGGFPQWNCSCSNCAAVRAGERRLHGPHAILAGGQPHRRGLGVAQRFARLRQQIAATPGLQSSSDKGLRNSPIKAVAVTNGDVDHITGLIHLREVQPFAVYATERVHQVISSNSVFNILAASSCRVASCRSTSRSNSRARPKTSAS